MKKMFFVLALCVIGNFLIGEELWERGWRNPSKYFWANSNARLKDIPANKVSTVGKHLYGAMGNVYYDGSGGQRWGIKSIWFGDFRMLDLKYSSKEHEELQSLSKDAVAAYMRLLDFLSWPDPTPGQITIVSEYKATVLKAAVLLSQCIDITYQNYDCYIANGGYESQAQMWAYARTKDGRQNALMDADVSTGSMLGYVLYVLRGQPTAARLEKIPEMKELYGVLDRLLRLLQRWGLIQNVRSGRPELDNVESDTSFFATSFPFTGY